MSKFANKRYHAPQESTVVKSISIHPTTIKRVARIHSDFDQFTRDALEYYLDKCEFDIK